MLVHTFSARGRCWTRHSFEAKVCGDTDVTMEAIFIFIFLFSIFCGGEGGSCSQSGHIRYQQLADETEEIKEDRVCVSEGTGAFNVSVDTTCRVCCAWLTLVCVCMCKGK